MVWQDFVAGSFAGGCGVLAGLDTIKVRLQSKTTAAHYRGTWHCLRTILREERVWGLYKGMSSPIFGVAAVNSLLFGVYGFLIDLQMQGATERTGAPTLGQVYLAGAGSGAVNALFSSPIELVKIRLQNQIESDARPFHSHAKMPTVAGHRLYSGPIDCVRTLWRAQGVRGLFRGLPATVWRETPSYGAYFVAFEWLCERMVPAGTDPNVPSAAVLLAGGLAGVVGWLVTYPFDVVKTRMQSYEQEAQQLYRSTWDCFAKVYRSEGAAAFFSGAGATIIRAFPTNAATFYALVVAKRFLEGAPQER